MANKSTATKALLASLLATSAIVPAMAVSADTTTETKTTEAVTKKIDFTLEDTTKHLANYIKGPGNLLEMNGQQYIEVLTSDAVLAMITEATVDGKTIVVEHGGKKHIYIPVNEKFEPVTIQLKIAMGPNVMDSTAILTPNKDSITGGASSEKPAESTKPAEEKLFTAGKTFESVADGIYDVKWDAYKGEIGNYTAITGQLSPDAKLVVNEGKYSVEISTIAKSNHFIKNISVEGKEAKVLSGTANEGDVRVLSFDIDSISDLHSAKIDLDVAGRAMSHDFGFAIETADLDLPTAETKPAAPEAKTEPVYVYKDGTKELSIMHGRYLEETVSVTATEGGYDVDVTFPEGQWINDFKVEGATVALKSEEIVENNNVQVYTVSVKDLAKLYTATIDLSVNQGPVKYDSVHKVQLQFGDSQTATVPFKDIANNGNKDAIINLYNKGIFKAADKFNPDNNLKRYQFALMLNRALKLDVTAKANFSDIAKFDAETITAINALNGYGIINGKTATTFAPGQDITRKQAALMIYRLLEKNGYKASGEAANFSDMPKEVEASKAISELEKLGIISGYEGKFNPENKLIRSHMAKILNNTLTVIDGLKK
ncbi:NEAT domain-containing protein [Solibacillus sp. FSL W7-1464]|uniref:NEAT domain-containing protein n=1 Tax=Solibacillus sp. FSL W7-1464 TaxID=2921706 RepID=UPI0030F746AA